VAADALCRLGDRAGVAVMLSEGWNLSLLNALRNPEAWSRLKSRRITEPWEAPHRDLLDRLSREAGLPVECAAPANDEEKAWMKEVEKIWSGKACRNLADVLDFLEHDPYQAILESDRIRIVPRAEALKFWKAWAAERR
jgi:hypothetical protein